ncbi:hypothetical protein ACFQE0_27360 [Methylobacterium komagatae]|uniref:Uncharacterized protein n=1 Tax=Methylobacterium komagatae TaxID=374425 RepID=A0ABW2BR56_9HYPH
MADRLPTRAELVSLEHDEREAVIYSALDQRLADLARLKRIARATRGRANSITAIPPLRASINRLIARAAEFDIRVEVLRAA